MKYLAIGSAVVLVALIIAVTTIVFQRMELQARRSHVSWDSVKVKRMLDDAADIFRNAGAARTIEDSDILSNRTMKSRDQWLKNYNQLIDKETNA